MKMPKEVKSKLGWLVVLAAALSVSWWSFYSLTVDTYGMPQLFGVIISTAFDGAAMVTGSLAQRYARTPDSGFGPRFATMVFVALSAFINGMHAHILWQGRGATSVLGIVLLSSLPVVAGWLFELEMKFLHKEHQRKFGRVPQALPAFGKWAWLLHRKKAYEAINVVVLDRMQKVVEQELGTRDHSFFTSTVAPESKVELMRDDSSPEESLELPEQFVGMPEQFVGMPELTTGTVPESAGTTDDSTHDKAVETDEFVAGYSPPVRPEGLPESPESAGEGGSNPLGFRCVGVDSSCDCPHRNALESFRNQSEAVEYGHKVSGINGGNDLRQWLLNHGRKVGTSTVYDVLKASTGTGQVVPFRRSE